MKTGKIAELCLAIASMASVGFSESIRWCDGEWDDFGAPKGKLLSDNHHFYGPRIFTGMTYEYEVAPTEPADAKGVRLRGANNWIRDNSFVGRPGDKPITVVFDFKRPCTFNEVVLFSPFCTNAVGTLQFSSDKVSWSDALTFTAVASHTRVWMCEPGKGRYMRLAFKADPKAQFVMDRGPEDRDAWLRERCVWTGPAKLGHTYLNEVYVWGDGEVSKAYPEDIKAIPSGNSMLYPGTEAGKVSILPMRSPYLDRKPTGATPTNLALTMARNEMESRYFAVVNGKKTSETIAFSAPSFGEGVSAELLIGGLARRNIPKRVLTDEEMSIMATTNRELAAATAADELHLLPFFFADAKPYDNCARKFLANPKQVKGFPDAVELAPGEGCVVMLRLKSDMAKVGKRRGELKAGAARLPIEVEVVNLVLPQQRNWMYAYEPFTQQYPFESRSRMMRDAQRFAESGFNCTKLLPKPGTKERMFFDMVHGATVGYYPWIDRSLYPRLLKGEFSTFTDAEKQLLLQNARSVLARASKTGLRTEDVIVFLPDEPRIANARSTMELAKFLKENIPNIQLNCDPLFHEGPKGFLPDEEIIGALGGYYNKYVDCSSPIMFIAAERPKLMKELWTKPRRINGQYAHPGTRIVREMAYAAYANGFNGHAYYCYLDDLERVDPWDTTTWSYNDYCYQAVYPLEGDVALTILYESMREASEDYRMLDALKQAGKADVLKNVLDRAAAGAWDRTNVKYRTLNPKAEDILDLRETILRAFSSPSAEVRWIDGKDIPIEGKAFSDVRSYFDRLPAGMTTNVNADVHTLQRCSSSMQFRFVTDSRKLRMSWKPCRELLALDHMPSTAVSGIDIYRFDEKGGWQYVKTGRITKLDGGWLEFDWKPNTPCLVNLPLYNGIDDFKLGVDSNATIKALGPRKSGVDKPVVFYGTSITQGGCCSRPGTHFINRLGRDLDVPVVGLGFSGSGFMELEMSEHLSRIDASCYVLDCVWNMCLSASEAPGRSMERNYEPFIRNLRRLRPEVPIVMAEWCNVFAPHAKDARDRFMKALYDRLIAEGWKNLHYLAKDEMYSGDGEGTVDGIHPNDLGMETMAAAYGDAVACALRLPPKVVPKLGYMLDVSRDKVPTMNTLRRIVDVIAQLGYNQFQLYTEHTFAYAGHEQVWKDASPLTPAEIRELDDYCWQRGVELVPNQNSFGHLEQWLKHAEYRHLAEAPDCPVNPWGGKAPYPKALCPTDPASTNFLAGLYRQMLPCFRHTQLFNVGCDEVFDLMPGVRSAAQIASRGESAVFLDHFCGLRTLAADEGKGIMYWANHLLRSPAAYDRLPKDAVALVYAYEADDGMDFLAERAVRLGVPFYVAPGTSSWCSLFGRYWNMKLNVAGAFDTARRFGAQGCLLCDWGDLGHIQPFIVSLPALVYASECAKGKVPSDERVVAIIDRLTGAKCGASLLVLGDLYRLAYDSQLNTTALFRLLQEGRNYKRPWYWTEERLSSTFAAGREALAKIDASKAPQWVRDECELLGLILEATELSWKREYAKIAGDIADRYRKLWLRQNRPGGLEDSVSTLFGDLNCRVKSEK